MKSFNFKEGQYAVLLRTCTGDKTQWPSMLPDYVYLLSRDSNNFEIGVVKGSNMNDTNGWSIGKEQFERTGYYIEMRLATPREIEAYKKAGKPVPAIPESVNDINESYEIF